MPHTSSLIPTVWRIDVEPDLHQPSVGEKPWDGFSATVALVDELRQRLQARSGRTFHPTWLLRMDPDVERCFGRPDFVVHRHSELFDALIAHGDPLGVHVHPYRWNAARGVAYSDHADTSWATHCFHAAVQAFEHAFDKPARLASQGGYFLTEAILDTAEELGIAVDLTVEPGLAPKSADPSFGAYASAPSTDFTACPRRPYYPSRGAFDVSSSSPADSRSILIIPLAAYDYGTALRPWYRQLARRLLGRRSSHSPLNPWKRWPSPKTFWDLMARAADEQPVRYLAFATRTDRIGSRSYEGVRALMECLPSHPIAERLHFVDPLSPEIRTLAVP